MYLIAVIPQIMFVASQPMVPVRGNTLLTCTITAEPTANSSQIVRILPDGEQIVVANGFNPNGDREFQVQYMFNRVRFPADDGAFFQCRSTNDNGPNATNLTIIVQGEPYIENAGIYNLYVCRFLVLKGRYVHVIVQPSRWLYLLHAVLYLGGGDQGYPP